jgi:hypothetical protein
MAVDQLHLSARYIPLSKGGGRNSCCLRERVRWGQAVLPSGRDLVRARDQKLYIEFEGDAKNP